MIVIVASRYDAAARRLAHSWAARRAVLLTPDDLTAPGWSWRFGSDEASGGDFGIGGVAYSGTQIQAVLSCLPCVTEAELPLTAEADRSYVARELQAFLLAWLANLSCPVLNRPSTTSLIGPSWRREQWLLAAREAGLNTVKLVRRAGQVAGPAPMATQRFVTLVGSRVFDAPEPSIATGVRALARRAGVELLSLACEPGPSGWQVSHAETKVPLDRRPVTDAILEHLS